MDKDNIFEIAEQILDFAEIAIPSPETYKRYRAKVLRIFNNFVREHFPEEL